MEEVRAHHARRPALRFRLCSRPRGMIHRDVKPANLTVER
jgi:hypothetical protein